MKSVQEHYAGHLASFYAWMVGGTEAAIAAGESEVAALQLPVRGGDRILDLGSGLGAHAIPLARRGAHVTAVDSSAELLATLREFSGNLALRIVNADLLDFLRSDGNQYAAILCMGDTLTHLKNADEVHALLESAYSALLPDGMLVLTFRDYTSELRGEQRFIPVRSDSTRILTCFLEFEPSTVAVHDILHEERSERWETHISAYRKLRLPPDDVLTAMRGVGFDAHQEPGTRGMVRLVGIRS